jgi:hypothetical protein
MLTKRELITSINRASVCAVPLPELSVIAFAPDGFLCIRRRISFESLLPNALPLPPVEDTLAEAEPVQSASYSHRYLELTVRWSGTG